MRLLLSPYRLVTDHLIIGSLHIIKTPKGIDYAVEELNNSELRKNYSVLPKDARDALVWFNKDGMHFTRQDIKKTYDLNRSGVDFSIYSQAAMLRRIHELLLRLKPFADSVKWYHKVKSAKGVLTTSSCLFSNYKPLLEFTVIKENGRFLLDIFITINGAGYSLADFTRSHYLLESKGEYFLLSYKDYQTLEWVHGKMNNVSWTSQQDFAETILSRLEADYKVNRNNLFEVTTVDNMPVRRVMLSEISNSFLVLTPQWIYDGFLQEGAWREASEVVRDGKTFRILRNKTEEQALVHLIEGLHPNFPRQMNGYFYLSFADAQKKQWFAKAYHKLLDLEIEVTGMDMLKHFRYSSDKITTDTVVREEPGGLLRIEMKVCFGKEEVPLQELQKIVLAGQKAVLLKDGSLGILSEEWMQQYAAIVKHGKVEKQTLLAGRWMVVGGQLDREKTIVKQEWWNKWEQWSDPSGKALYPLPSIVQVASLRPYQQKGYEWIRLLSEAGCSGCLADDMGLGKTLQAICFIANRIECNAPGKHLVICPSSLIYNWQEELTRFAPVINKTVYHGTAREPGCFHDEKIDLIITSYGTLRADIDTISDCIFDTIVIDESHNIKNPSALTTKAVLQLQSTVRIALSGTPVMNNTFDLYGQLGFLLPGMLGSREFFKREYADPIDRDRDPEKIQSLQKLTSPFILRRTKEQVAPDLPSKTETILWCEMGDEQRFAYETIRENIRASLFLEIKDKTFGSGKLSVLHGIMKLRQVCNSCELIREEGLFAVDSVKTEVLLRELQHISGNHKALVFSQFTSMLDLLERDLKGSNIPYYRLDGSTEAAKRQELVNSFNSETSSARVFLLSLKAGNAGLNLTGADYVFLFDPWWNRAVEQQAIDRTHRIGQQKSIFAYKMICRNTIEEKILTLQQQKSKLSEELIGGDEDGFIKNLTPDDLEFLFS